MLEMPRNRGMKAFFRPPGLHKPNSASPLVPRKPLKKHDKIDGTADIIPVRSAKRTIQKLA